MRGETITTKVISPWLLSISRNYSLNKVIEYIVKNGMMKDLRVLMESPFTDMDPITLLFGNNMELWSGIRQTIQQINDNADMVA